jgi:hypothetical protein
MVFARTVAVRVIRQPDASVPLISYQIQSDKHQHCYPTVYGLDTVFKLRHVSEVSQKRTFQMNE